MSSLKKKNGFNPADEHFKRKNTNKATTNQRNDGLIIKAKDIFTRVPTLWALFCEILACQGLSTLLNVLCVTKVSEVIPDDTERAGWMGKVSMMHKSNSLTMR
jgi:ATP/ADP translocase